MPVYGLSCGMKTWFKQHVGTTLLFLICLACCAYIFAVVSNSTKSNLFRGSLNAKRLKFRFGSLKFIIIIIKNQMSD